ncbi:MAG: MliC family protein [Spirochaetes bacterium]|nr:MliC family protein [Spirochaetota bacterium]MBX3722830.1 MliC family protein [Turneriella sp.]
MKLMQAAATVLVSLAAGACSKKDPKISEFKCDRGAIAARFGHNGKKQVYLKLGDGRAMTLPYTPSVWGTRYATRDSLIVFVVKDNDAIFEEDGERPFGTCSAA